VAFAKRALHIEILGADFVKRQLFRGAQAAGDMEPALSDIADDMMRIMDIQFQSQGRRGGGSWAHLSTDWYNRKAELGYDLRILFAEGYLHESMTVRGSPEQILEIDGKSLSIDTEVEYADIHQHGGRGIPARPFAVFLDTDKARWARMCEDSLYKAMKG